MIERIYILETVDPVIFYGVNNSNMQLIKTLFPKLRIVARGNVMKVIGDEEESELFLKKIREIEKYCEEFNSLSEEVIIDIVKGKGPTVVKQENLIIHGMNGKPITARTENQQLLVKAFEENDLVFATGPAGSGKTFVAIALAVKALKNKEVRKIILSRPAVEAGEKLGFLPGEMKDKLDPYLQDVSDTCRHECQDDRNGRYDTDRFAGLGYFRIEGSDGHIEKCTGYRTGRIQQERYCTA